MLSSPFLLRVLRDVWGGKEMGRLPPEALNSLLKMTRGTTCDPFSTALWSSFKTEEQWPPGGGTEEQWPPGGGTCRGFSAIAGRVFLA